MFAKLKQKTIEEKGQKDGQGTPKKAKVSHLAVNHVSRAVEPSPGTRTRLYSRSTAPNYCVCIIKTWELIYNEFSLHIAYSTTVAFIEWAMGTN